MKSRGEKLQKHYRQAFEYWIQLVPDRPRYVVLCNFDEFWIYDFNYQLDEPVDRVTVAELPDRYTAFNFLFPDDRPPLFGNDRVAVTRAAADKVAQVFNSLVSRGEDRQRAQRFILQCVVGMFSEDFDLLPRGLFTELLGDCANGESSFDLLGSLFRQMNSPTPARGGRFQRVAYFNGGLFQVVDPLEFNKGEAAYMRDASSENWAKVAPPIFGTLFQSSMDEDRRHAFGAHFTSEADIQKVVLPTIVRPWRERIAKTSTLNDLLKLSKELLAFRVLDPACGSGNFLYVAYRELVNLEMEILAKIHEKFGARAKRSVGTASLVSTKQFFGIDLDPFAVELAKVTLMLGKRIALAETHDSFFAAQQELPFEFEEPLPLDNLDDNIVCQDALFYDWPDADAIIGNPPYQSKNKMLEEYGREYLDRVRGEFSEVPGRADFCVYWFRRAHDELSDGGRAGLVGTNTIRQNYSREGGLDHIVADGGTITEAVSSQVWSGDAVVHVSIVNWLKGEQAGKKRLYKQVGDQRDSPWEVTELDKIGASLSPEVDVTSAVELRANVESGACYQGQTHGHKGFLLTPDEASVLRADKSSRAVIHPYLTGDELLGAPGGRPQRYAIDLNACEDLLTAMKHKAAFEHVKKHVMPDILAAAAKEREKSGSSIGPRQSHAGHWWKFWRGRGELITAMSGLSRYIACARVTKRPIFAFIDTDIRPNDALQVFALEDDYSFGILQSSVHWIWFVERCSTLKGDFRYTSNSVFDSFPWPQSPTPVQVRAVAKAAKQLRQVRDKALTQFGWTLRELYRTLEVRGDNPLKQAHADLDSAVRAAFGLRAAADPLPFLLKLNEQLAENEASMKPVVTAGLPPSVKDRKLFVTTDSVRMSS
jgi:SAM-dependent methyltransferase